MELETIAGDLLTKAIAPSTIRTYSRAISIYSEFTRKTYKSTLLFPTPLSTLLTFIAHLFVNQCSSSSILTYISALSYVNKLSANEDNTTHFLVKKLLKGVQRSAQSPDVCLPIEIDFLGKILDNLHLTVSSHYKVLMFKALFALMFHAFLRAGEVTIRSKVLQLQDCSFTMRGQEVKDMIITISQFKSNTDQKPFRISIAPSFKSTHCPVTAMRDYLRVRKASEGPLFCLSPNTAVSRQLLSETLSTCLQSIGVNASRYKAHSFRLGSATTCAKLGFSDSVIQRLGRWKSDAFKRYIRVPCFSSPS